MRRVYTHAACSFAPNVRPTTTLGGRCETSEFEDNGSIACGALSARVCTTPNGPLARCQRAAKRPQIQAAMPQADSAG